MLLMFKLKKQLSERARRFAAQEHNSTENIWVFPNSDVEPFTMSSENVLNNIHSHSTSRVVDVSHSAKSSNGVDSITTDRFMVRFFVAISLRCL